MEMLRNWIVTFGYDHRDPVTGDSLADRYVKVTAETEWRAREIVTASYGTRWAFIYSNEQRAGVERFNLREAPLRTPDEIEDARLLRDVARLVGELSRPLWVYRAANAMCPPNRVTDPRSPAGRSALTRRRNAAREIYTIVSAFIQKIESETV